MEGLPQLFMTASFSVGRGGDEAAVLRASAAFEQAWPWEHQRPAID